MSLRQTIVSQLRESYADSCGADFCWMICRRILAAILLTSAALKAYELDTLPFLESGLLNQRWLLNSTIGVEFVLGGWLLIGSGNYRTWVVTLALWFTFTCVSGYEAILGVGSCGCFGRVYVNPLYTASFDLLIVLILPFCRPTAPLRATRHTGWRRTTMVAIAAASVAFGVWNVHQYSSDRLNADGLTVVDGVIVLEPAKWVHHPFMLAPYIDIGSTLIQGDWIVLFYRDDCEFCQRAVPHYEALAEPSAAFPHSDASHIAVVEIPPYAPLGQKLVRPNMLALAGRLTNEHEWFAATPIGVWLHDGTVRAFVESDAAQDPTALLEKRNSDVHQALRPHSH